MRCGSRRLIQLVAVVVSMVLAVTFVSGCGSDATSAPAPSKVVNPPDASLAKAIFERGVRATTLTPADATQMLDVLLASNGLVAAERGCAAPKLLPLLQPDASGSVRVSMLGKVVQRIQLGRESTAMAQAVTACIGPESAARLKAKTAAPDRDLTGVDGLALRVSTAEAAAVGFTATEANCFATHFLNGVPLDQVAAIFSGTMTGKATVDPRAAVSGCVSADRQAALAVQARKEADVYAQCVKDVSAEISKQLAEAANGSTTTAAPGAPTTTIQQCI